MKALPRGGEKLMPTLFEQLKEEGREEGREEILQEGIELVLLILELKYGKEGLFLQPKIRSINSLVKLREVKQLLQTDVPLQKLSDLLDTM